MAEWAIAAANAGSRSQHGGNASGVNGGNEARAPPPAAAQQHEQSHHHHHHHHHHDDEHHHHHEHQQQQPSTKSERAWASVPYRAWAAADSPALKRSLRYGCPPALRPDVWYHASGGAALAAAAADASYDGEGAAVTAADGTPMSSGTYQDLVRSGYVALARCRGDGGVGTSDAAGGSTASGCGAPLGRNSIRSAISGDAWIALREEAAPRSLPKVISDQIMGMPAGAAALQRILVAYAAHNPAPGALWRGVGACAAFILAVVRDEQRAFWTLAGLAQRLFGEYGGQVRALLGRSLGRSVIHFSAALLIGCNAVTNS
jgi:hypothetical protein